MGFAKRLGFCALVALVSSAANASVVYTFVASSAFSGGPFGSFTYTAPSLITSNQTIPAGALDTCVVTFPSGDLCGTMQFVPDTAAAGLQLTDDNDAIGFTDASALTTVYYYFANGAFSAPGVYLTVLFGTEQAATLTIRSDGVVPEPATLGLLGLSLAGLAFSRRRKQ